MKKLSTYKWLDDRFHIKQDMECELNFEDRKTVIEVATLIHQNCGFFSAESLIMKKIEGLE